MKSAVMHLRFLRCGFGLLGGEDLVASVQHTFTFWTRSGFAPSCQESMTSRRRSGLCVCQRTAPFSRRDAQKQRLSEDVSRVERETAQSAFLCCGFTFRGLAGLLFLCVPLLVFPADMSSSFFERTRQWVQRLVRNPYWWGGLTVLLLIGGTLYIAFDNYVMPTYTRHEAAMALPHVEGMPYSRAEELLSEKGLRVERQKGRYNPNVARDEVVDQTPHSGSTVKPRRRVYLTVNSGTARRVAVPDVLTLSVRSAQNRLRTAGLRVDSIRQDTIPAENAGTVTRQLPSPGDSLDVGEGVVLWEAQGAGEEQVRVPNVYGLSVARAKRRLLRVRLRSTVLDTLKSDSSLASLPRPQRNRQLFVMGQHPLPGASLLAGKDVRLFVTSDSIQASQARPPAQEPAKPGSGSASNRTRSTF